MKCLILPRITRSSLLENVISGGKNQHFRHLLFYAFHQAQKAAEAARYICYLYGKGVIWERAAQKQESARFPNRSEVKETEQGTNVSNREAARNEISEKYPNTSRRMVNRAIRNDKGEPKCFNCNQFGHIARDCPVPKATLTCRGCGQTGHKEINCTRPKEGLKVANLEVEGLKTVPPDVYLKDAKIDNKETVKAMIDTGSSSCLLRESVARRINVDIEPDSTSLYDIGNQTAPAARTVGKTTVDLEIDGVVGKEIAVFIVNDDAQPYDLLIGRTWTDLPYVSFAKIG
ncbi:hypothetical protein LAZ67_5003109 [Cordylochernes scorpioides]|uniref:CCHC-type domain-containing protein n=1 Tax=Cordylochernes scorpioides TaxID=51811 RepID=A0ABY6KKI7_9ARAC|nr:hypothetical protein LAZ67_5003109 [Cordylochernes scorpioides]